MTIGIVWYYVSVKEEVLEGSPKGKFYKVWYVYRRYIGGFFIYVSSTGDISLLLLVNIPRLLPNAPELESPLCSI